MQTLMQIRIVHDVSEDARVLDLNGLLYFGFVDVRLDDLDDLHDKPVDVDADYLQCKWC